MASETYDRCPLCGLRNANTLQNVGCARHLGYPDACEVRIRDKQIAALQEQLATANARIEAAERVIWLAEQLPLLEVTLKHSADIFAYDTARAEYAKLAGGK